MKFILLPFFTAIFFVGNTQTIEEIDKVATLVCENLKESWDDEDGEKRIMDAFNANWYPFLETVNPDKREEIGDRFFFRLQRNCLEFGKILDLLNPKDANEDFEDLNTKPPSSISQKEISEFKNHQKLYYQESNGTKTYVKIGRKNWKDIFADGTYSKLSLKWTSQYEFSLYYKKSNNHTRSNMSVKGDEYNYTLLSKEDGYFYLALEIPGTKKVQRFKMFFEAN
jgi:hypothetical protein